MGMGIGMGIGMVMVMVMAMYIPETREQECHDRKESRSNNAGVVDGNVLESTASDEEDKEEIAGIYR